MNKRILWFLNRKMEELMLGKKVRGFHRVFWLNPVTMEIYATSEESFMVGVKNGYKVCNVTNDWRVEV